MSKTRKAVILVDLPADTDINDVFVNYIVQSYSEPSTPIAFDTESQSITWLPDVKYDPRYEHIVSNFDERYRFGYLDGFVTCQERIMRCDHE